MAFSSISMSHTYGRSCLLQPRVTADCAAHNANKLWGPPGAAVRLTTVWWQSLLGGSVHTQLTINLSSSQLAHSQKCTYVQGVLIEQRQAADSTYVQLYVQHCTESKPINASTCKRTVRCLPLTATAAAAVAAPMLSPKAATGPLQQHSQFITGLYSSTASTPALPSHYLMPHLLQAKC